VGWVTHREKREHDRIERDHDERQSKTILPLAQVALSNSSLTVSRDHRYRRTKPYSTGWNMSIPKASRRYFSPALNLWYRAVVAKPWRVQIGLTERGLDDLGDIVAVRQAEIMGHRRNLSAVAKVSAGEDLIHVHWEGTFVAPRLSTKR